jgi:crotonobetainyl-CoA:carnitine CoA-transferase CaiB-like acyl-CoA transferase
MMRSGFEEEEDQKTEALLFTFVWDGDAPPSELALDIECDRSAALSDAHLQLVFANSQRGVEQCVWSVWRQLAAVVLLRLRRGGVPHARARIDARLALLEFASEQFVLPRTADLWDPLSGLFRCADDRFVRLHCNFPHHRRAALALLGFAPPPPPPPHNDVTRDAVAERLRLLDAFELERRAVEFNAVVAAARTPDEWRRAPLAAQIANDSKHLFEYKLMQSQSHVQQTSAPAPTIDKPLNGVRVVDLTRVLAGPICCRVLARYGADVTRVWHSSVRDTDAVLRDTTRGKRHLELDLKSRDGVEQLHALLERADVIVSAFRPGVMLRLGLGDEELARRHPRLIVARITAFGESCGLRGFDSIVQTATGMNLANNATTPRPLVFQMLDHATGILLASAIIAALSSRRRQQQQHIIHCSLVATAAWFQRRFANAADDDGFARRDIGAAPLATIGDALLQDSDLETVTDTPTVEKALSHCISIF